MNKDERSLLDEMWDAAGLNKDGEQQPPKAEETQAEDPKAEEPQAEEPKAEEPAKEEPKAEEKPKKAQNPPAEKKKDIKFLVLYTTVFVIVISGLIAGSYMITSRIHNQMSENNEQIDLSQSTLKNIQDENAALKTENAALKTENQALATSQSETEELLDSMSDMVEQDGYLTAAQSAYINGDRSEAREILSAIDREKLSEPNKAFYDILKDKLS